MQFSRKMCRRSRFHRVSEMEGGDATEAVREAESGEAEASREREEKGRWGSMGPFPAAAMANLLSMLHKLILF